MGCDTDDVHDAEAVQERIGRLPDPLLSQHVDRYLVHHHHLQSHPLPERQHGGELFIMTLENDLLVFLFVFIYQKPLG